MADDHTHQAQRGSTLSVALGTTVALWTVLYLAALPSSFIPFWLALAAAGILILAGGWVLGVHAGRGWAGGLALGVLVSAFNLIILASLLGGSEPGTVVRSAAGWIGAWSVAAIVLGAAGAEIGRMSRRGKPAPDANWSVRFATVAAVTVGLMLVSGGIVTGLEAGMAIEGWLTSDGYPMVLYPVSLMRADQGAFVEHAHRLWGLLVGLMSLLLAVHVWRIESRRAPRWVTLGILLAVIVQGLLGGTRVIEDSLALAVIHGVFGQVVFAAILAVAALTATGWTQRPRRTSDVAASLRRGGTMLVGLLLLQLTLGALYRHLNTASEIPAGVLHGVLTLHILTAVVVTIVALFAAGRVWGRYADVLVLGRLGVVIMAVIGAQLALGVVSVIMILYRGGEQPIPALEVVFTTAHQVVGALLLGLATLLRLWVGRLLLPGEADATAPVAAPEMSITEPPGRA